MNVVGIKILVEFKKKHGDIRGQLDSWLCEVNEAKWTGPQDIKDRYPSASILSDNRIIFDMKGKKYRLLNKINYQNAVVLIIKIGTHTQYSKWKL